MGLFSFFRRRAGAAPAASQSVEAADSVQQARVRARRRLIGAVVLVVVGVIGFPLVFETQPRPIPVDIPIDIPRKDGLPALVMPQARVATPSPTATPAAPTPAPAPAIPARADGAARAPASSQPAALPVEPRPTPPAAPLAATKTPPPAAAEPAPRPEPAGTPRGSDATRAQALLDGKTAAKPAAPTDAARYVVQVGAFAENSAAHETRVKVEKLGLKTYAQAADTDAGKRIRVRVGPFTSKEDAEQARGRLKAAGFPAVLLTL